jgi:hypothetical protein
MGLVEVFVIVVKVVGSESLAVFSKKDCIVMSELSYLRNVSNCAYFS